MTRSLRLVLIAVLAALVTALSVPAAVVAAPDPDRAHKAIPGTGKGDTDGDRIADDLEAAVAKLKPGDRVPVIVQGGTPAAARRAAPSFRTGQRYTIIPAFSGSVNAGQVTALSHIPSVTRVELDGIASAVDAAGEQDYGVTDARAAITPSDGTLDGSGVGICIIDTGIDPTHEQFTPSRVIAWKDWVNNRSTPYDDHGHGTHVAGIAAGDGSGTADASRYGGVARGADLAIAKVLNSAGSGSDSNVVAAIQWCVSLSAVRVISMSLGSPGGDGSDAGSQAVNAAVAAGKVVVVAAGNSGDAPGTISSPGVATGAVTIGAASDPSTLSGGLDTDSGLYLAGFSGRGPTTNQDAPLKPDVVAPGLSVVAAKANAATSYVAMSGTSMATPFVTGVVALGLEAVPGASPTQVKAALQSSARDAGVTGADNEWGYGLVDARAFLGALGAGAPGTAAWPDQTVISGSVASGATKDFPFDVMTAGKPLGVTLQTTNGAATCAVSVGGSCWLGYEWAPDLDAYLVNPGGSVVASSRCMLSASNGNCSAPGRFETLGIASAAAGTWKLRVESFSGSGSFSASVFGALGTPAPPTPPAAPSNLTATATSSSQINLSWTDNSNNETGFEIERCTGSTCTEFALINTVTAGTTSWSNTGLAAATSYSYRVRAANTAGNSDYSIVAGATTPSAPTIPAAPSALTAVAKAKNAVQLTWTDNSNNETGFRIERCTGSTCSNFTAVATVGVNAVAYTNTGLKANTTYRYRVAAYNSAGSSVYSNIGSATTPRR